MNNQRPQGSGGEDEPPRAHPQDPSEGAREPGENEPSVHSQDPAEGGDDSSATE